MGMHFYLIKSDNLWNLEEELQAIRKDTIGKCQATKILNEHVVWWMWAYYYYIHVARNAHTGSISIRLLRRQLSHSRIEHNQDECQETDTQKAINDVVNTMHYFMRIGDIGGISPYTEVQETDRGSEGSQHIGAHGQLETMLYNRTLLQSRRFPTLRFWCMCKYALVGIQISSQFIMFAIIGLQIITTFP